MRSIRLLLATGALLLAAGPARAQTADSVASPDTAALRALVNQVCPGRSVLVAVDGRQRGPATCTALPDARLLVDLGDARLTPRLVEIEEVWVRERNTGSGALTGAAVGAVAFAGAAAYIGYALCEHNECARESYREVTLSGLVGAAVGGLIGSAFGYASKVWKRRYAASP